MPGKFTFVLHTHLPYVLHHGKWPFGSDWLSEAVAECYLPLLGVLDRLSERNIRTRISMAFSPVLLEQLADEDFPEVFTNYCTERIDLAEKDILLFSKNKERQYIPLARYWKEFYESSLRAFTNWYSGDLIGAFRRHSNNGSLDIMTCAATHGYLPLLLDDRNVRAQLRVAIDTHQKYFGKAPRGIWLPECAYRPRYFWNPPAGGNEIVAYARERAGIEELLAEVGLEYFVVEGSLTKGGIAMNSYNELLRSHHDEFENDSDWTRYATHYAEHEERSLSELYKVRSTHRPIKGQLPVVFSRDRRTSEQVWSGDIGYPGDPNYLEFHKKHHNSGLRYWKVSGSQVDLANKDIYDPKAVEERLQSHAEHFLSLVADTLTNHTVKTGQEGIVCSPFDTELFGHWWFEGPRFIEKVIETIGSRIDITLTHCAEALDERSRPYQTIALPEGSWGEGGGHYVWLNHTVVGLWDKIYELEDRFLQNISRYRLQKKPKKILTNYLKQAARELLLLEASDWQFLITTQSAEEYSNTRFEKHCKRLSKLLKIVDGLFDREETSKKEKEYLKKVSHDDHPFSEIRLEHWL